MASLAQQNPRIQRSHTNVINPKKYRKDISTTLKSTSLRGKPPLHYINEQFLDDTNDKTFLLYIGV